MTVTAAQFRQDFPEFADVVQYPSSAFTFWAGVAAKFVNAQRWAGLADVGVELYVAHQLVLERRAADDSANGTPPGGQVGPVNSNSVDKASVAFDTASGIEMDAGHWNLSVYGTRFIRLARMMGAGVVQVGGAGHGGGPLSSGGAWVGPDCNPGFTTFS